MDSQKRIFCAEPLLVYSTGDGAATNSGFFSPCRQALSLSEGSDQSRGAAITGLLFAGGPLAVFWTVIFVVINALNGVSFGRLLSHVCKESSEVSPPGAHLNSTATIVLVNPSIRIVATLVHINPNIPLRSFAFAVSFTKSVIGMISRNFNIYSCFLSAHTPTAFDNPEARLPHYFHSSALALNFPPLYVMLLLRKFWLQREDSEAKNFVSHRDCHVCTQQI